MKKLLVLIVMLFLIFGLIKWRQISMNSVPDVMITEVSHAQISDTILASGNLSFNTEIKLRSEITGIVTAIYVDEGQYVKQGQLLLELDPTSFKAEMDRNQALVNRQQIEIERVQALKNELSRQLLLKQSLYQQKLVSDDEIARLQNELQLADIGVNAALARLSQEQALLDFANDRLAKTRFVAAMDGLIASVDIKVGETVVAGTTNIVGSSLMTLADPESILAELRIDEADIANVQLGQTVNVFIASAPHQKLTASVTSIAASARAHPRTQSLYFKVKALIKDNSMLFPGMSCRAEVITAKSELSAVVPLSAVGVEGERYYLWIVEAGIAKKQYVELGMANEMLQIIKQGVQQTQQVVIGPARVMDQLVENMSVNSLNSEVTYD